MKLDWSPVARCVRRLSADTEIAVSIATPDGQHWGCQADVQVPAASTAKIAIMVEVFRQLERGALGHEDLYRVDAHAHARGSGVLRFMHDGLRLTTDDLVYLMMAISDNTATNLLIERVGMHNINATMRELGMRQSVLGRLMVGRLAIEGEQENLATASDYTGLMSALWSGQAASGTSCERMLEIMTWQQNGRRIGRYVPAAPGFRWGAKNGTNTGIVNEVGFIAAPGGTVLLSVYCREVCDEMTGEGIVAQIARSAMQATGIIGPD